MSKLELQAQKEIKKAQKESLNRLKKDYESTKQAIQQTWYYKQFLTKKQLENLEQIKERELKQIIKAGVQKDYEKTLKDRLKKIAFIKNHNFNECNWGICSIDWGNLAPRGEYRNGHDYQNFRSVTGCGYDKLSTLTAEMLNSDMFLMSYICNYIEKHAINKNNIREKLGYGISLVYGKPSFDGGVGVNCHISILKKLGFNVIHTSTKRSDYIEFTKRGLK